MRGHPTSWTVWNVGKEPGFSLDRQPDTAGAFYSSSEVVANEIHHALGDSHLVLLTDFDGTLAEIAPTPAAATMTTDVRDAIAAIAALDSVTFGVVSGRRLDDVRARVEGAAEFVAGLHGLEISGRHASFRHGALDSATPVIAHLAETAARQLAWCRGVYLENKTHALTCHVRLVPDRLVASVLEQFEALARPLVARHVLKLLSGAKALEVLPYVDWDKGRAAEWIRRHVEVALGRHVTVVYLGDDRTDEDAFDALRDEDIVIGVGDRPHAHSIDWRLAGPASVGRLFARLARLRHTE